MKVVKSAGIILFRYTPKGLVYLVLRSSNQIPTRGEFWDFPKGQLEKGETGLEGAKREVFEETGIKDFKLDIDFKETIRYFTWIKGKRAIKFVAMFLAEAKNAKVKLSWEHDKYKWLPYKKAHETISLKEMKEPLKKADEYLQSKNI